LVAAHLLISTLCAGVLWRSRHAPGPLSTRAANAVQVATFPVSFAASRLLWRFGGGMPVTFAACVLGLTHWTIGAGVLIALRQSRRARPAAETAPAEPLDFQSGIARSSRRVFLAEAACAGGLLSASVSAAHATLVGPWDLRLRRYTVPITGLPGWADALRIVHLSDTHLGTRVPPDHIARAVDMACSLKPDLIVLTGDYVEHNPAQIDAAIGLFAPCITAARLGVAAVLGNHDWYADGPRTARALRAEGVLVLDNARTFLTAHGRFEPVESPGCVCLAGLGDLWQDAVRPGVALGGVGPSTPRIVLSHNPDAAELPDVRAERVDLMLSGHTHGGQVRVPLLGEPVVPSEYGTRYAGGLCRAGGVAGGVPVVVSRGVGMSGLPVRVNCPPEVVEVTLARA
jgi:hypothetical protein